MNNATYGILEFPIPLTCSKKVLGKSFDIIVGGYGGILELPSLPKWGKNETDPLNKMLISPSRAKKWKRGSEEIVWGMPISYPNGISQVQRALFIFDFGDETKLEAGNTVYDAFPKWIELFEVYVELITKYDN